MTAAQIEALKSSGAYKGLVARLVATVERERNLNDTREERLRELERQNEELSMAQQRPRVLVVLYADGWVEVWSNEKLDLRLAPFPNCDRTAAAIEYFRTTMPRRYAELYDWNEYFRDQATSKDCRTPAQIIDHHNYLQALKKLDEWPEVWKKKPAQ